MNVMALIASLNASFKKPLDLVCLICFIDYKKHIYRSLNMTKISFSEAKAKLSKYARMAEDGESIIVEKHRKPSFILAPWPKARTPRKRRLGSLKGKLRMAKDFDATPDDVIESFYSGGAS